MDEEYYGATTASNEEMTVQERCREFYKIGEFVVVMNIDTKPFVYQVQRVENQSVNDEGVHQNIENIKPPERIIMQPGDMRLVPAYEADLMIKALIDRLVYSGRAIHIEAHKHDDQPEPPKESVRDPATQRKYIKAIYQGKRDFLDEFNSKKSELDDDELDEVKEENERLKAELEKLKVAQLGNNNDITDETPKRIGRPPKQTA